MRNVLKFLYKVPCSKRETSSRIKVNFIATTYYIPNCTLERISKLVMIMIQFFMLIKKICLYLRKFFVTSSVNKTIHRLFKLPNLFVSFLPFFLLHIAVFFYIYSKISYQSILLFLFSSCISLAPKSCIFYIFSRIGYQFI